MKIVCQTSSDFGIKSHQIYLTIQVGLNAWRLLLTMDDGYDTAWNNFLKLYVQSYVTSTLPFPKMAAKPKTVFLTSLLGGQSEDKYIASLLCIQFFNLFRSPSINIEVSISMSISLDSQARISGYQNIAIK